MEAVDLAMAPQPIDEGGGQSAVVRTRPYSVGLLFEGKIVAFCSWRWRRPPRV
jgi:hypothetical protein